MDEKVFISAEGLAEVKERLAYLKSTRRKEVADKLAEAHIIKLWSNSNISNS